MPFAGAVPLAGETASQLPPDPVAAARVNGIDGPLVPMAISCEPLPINVRLEAETLRDVVPTIVRVTGRETDGVKGAVKLILPE
jgi:hypothetical protein